MKLKHTLITFSLTFLAVTALHTQVVSSDSPKTQNSNLRTSLILDTDTRLDINNLEMFVYNDGNFAYDNANDLGKTDGLYFPRGSKKTVIYAAGLWVGAKVDGEIRLAVAEYSSEFGTGTMTEEGGYSDPNNSAFRVYKIRRGDSPQSNPDYANWPVDQGAPVDSEGLPAMLGDQMTWSVFNDANPAGHTNDAAATAPLGIEVQHTVFGYAVSGALGNTLFLKYKIINKGNNQLDDAYLSIWVDSDLGTSDDDLVGCDTLLSLGYCYNDGEDADYGAKPPAVGLDFLLGPVVQSDLGDSALVNGQWRSGYKMIPMTSFNKYEIGLDPESREQTYGYMQGLVKNEATGEMIPNIDPISQQASSFACPGDPVTQTGWVDSNPGDRRMMLSSGPFDMVPGDTQEIVVAVIVAQGSNALNSTTALKVSTASARLAYYSLIDFPCGDVDQSWQVDLRDLVCLVNYVFKHGPQIVRSDADVNCDTNIRITDCVYLINYLYLGGPAPCANCLY